LSVWQQEDRISISSAGPFRRPIRLSPDEELALSLALAMDPEGGAVAARFSAVTQAAGAPQPSAQPAPDLPTLLAHAISTGHRVELLYAPEGEPTASRWLIHPHQLVGWRGRTYLVAWSEATADWRHFRLDRIIDGLTAEGTFERRADFRPVSDPADLFRPAATPDAVRVRFSPRMARWARERYAGSDPAPDGSVTVTLRSGNPAWLVRRVLEFGDEAEVLEPESYRDAVRRAVA
jgi:proteasome accessory factor C